MSTREQLHSVVASLEPVIRGVADEDLDAPTPCPDFDVRAVANHLLGTIEAMRRVGADEPMDPDDPWGTNGDNVTDQWRDDLNERLAAFADAWSSPEAWEGDALGGAMPRRMVGGMGFVEAVLHGWDLAKGSGQQVAYDDATAASALEIMDQIGEMGRSQGAFGPEVPVADDAGTFARVLGKAGRDPEWTAT
jgi:uncharacterized protein (TIGR03086 family)